MAGSKALLRAKKKKAFSCIEGQRFGEAKALCTQVCRADGNDAEAWFLLGAINGQLGLFEEAVRCELKAVTLQPGYADAHYNLAQAHMHIGEAGNAIASYRRFLELEPDHAEAHNNLGYALECAGDLKAAAENYARAIRLKPDYAEAYLNMGNVVSLIGGTFAETSKYYFEAIALKPDYSKARCQLGAYYQQQGYLTEAARQFDLVLQAEPQNLKALAGKALLYEKSGHFTEGLELIQPYVEAGADEPKLAIAYTLIAARLKRPTDELIDLLHRQLEKPNLLALDQMALHDQLGRLCDQAARYDQAFAHFLRANQINPAYESPAEFLARFDDVKRIYTADFFASAPRASELSRRPIFIVGMPRSGTTLVEQVLSSHPEVCGGGELTALGVIADAMPGRLYSARPYPDCMTELTQSVADKVAKEHLDYLQQLCGDTLRVTDKMPHNFLRLGLIALLFPGAAIIHCRRHPLDTCMSIFTYRFNGAHPYATDLSELGKHYRKYLELMAHWRAVLPLPIFEVQYEDMVADQEQVSRKMVAFCGLEWDAQCLRFFENKRVVNTISYDQVRQPIYKKSVARWRHYGKFLAPLVAALGRENLPEGDPEFSR